MPFVVGLPGDEGSRCLESEVKIVGEMTASGVAGLLRSMDEYTLSVKKR